MRDLVDAKWSLETACLDWHVPAHAATTLPDLSGLDVAREAFARVIANPHLQS
jgi:hypothetical protein